MYNNSKIPSVVGSLGRGDATKDIIPYEPTEMFLLYDDKCSFAQITLALHNILEWGYDLEATGLLKLHERLYEW